MREYVAILSFNVNLPHLASLLKAVDIHMRVMMCGIIPPYGTPSFWRLCRILNRELYNLSFLRLEPDKNFVLRCDRQSVLCRHIMCITTINFLLTYLSRKPASPIMNS